MKIDEFELDGRVITSDPSPPIDPHNWGETPKNRSRFLTKITLGPYLELLFSIANPI